MWLDVTFTFSRKNFRAKSAKWQRKRSQRRHRIRQSMILTRKLSHFLLSHPSSRLSGPDTQISAFWVKSRKHTAPIPCHSLTFNELIVLFTVFSYVLRVFDQTPGTWLSELFFEEVIFKAKFWIFMLPLSVLFRYPNLQSKKLDQSYTKNRPLQSANGARESLSSVLWWRPVAPFKSKPFESKNQWRGIECSQNRQDSRLERCPKPAHFWQAISSDRRWLLPGPWWVWKSSSGKFSD